MYFSKNSGYVLRKAKCLSSTNYLFGCLKGTRRSLSVKSPNDDPSKPPLRLNVPNDSSQSCEGLYKDSSKFAQKDFPEPRSRSLLSRPNTQTFNSDLGENLQKKSESETQLSKFQDDMIQNVNNLEYSTSSELIEQNLKGKNDKEVNIEQNVQSSVYDYQKSGYDPIEGLVTLLDETYSSDSNVNKTLATSKYSTNDNYNDIEKNQKRKPSKNSRQKSGEESSNDIYFIIDVPQNQAGKKSANVNIQFKEPNLFEKSRFPEDQFATLKDFSHGSKSFKEKTKSTWPKKDQVSYFHREKNKNLSNYLSEKEDQEKSNVKFEVHEIDDASTYVFHLKLKRSLTNKPSSVECVPEKEINTRTPSFGREKNDPITIIGDRGIIDEGLNINPTNLTDGLEYSDKILKSVTKIKDETFSKNKSKSSSKIKSKRCLTDCSSLPVMPKKKDGEKSDKNKNLHKSVMHKSSEKPSQNDNGNKTKIDIQSLEHVKLPLENTSENTSQSHPLATSESSANQFSINTKASSNPQVSLKKTEGFYLPEVQEIGELSNNPEIPHQESNKNTSSQNNETSYYFQSPEMSEAANKHSDNHSENYQSLEPYSGNIEINNVTDKTQNTTGDLAAKTSPKVEENKSAGSYNDELEYPQDKKEYFTYPLIQPKTKANKKKTKVSTPEKKLKGEKKEYSKLSSSLNQEQNQYSALCDSEAEYDSSVAEKKMKEFTENFDLSIFESYRSDRIGVCNKEAMKLAFLQFIDKNKSSKFDSSEKKQGPFQLLNMQGGEKWRKVESEQINRRKYSKKIGDHRDFVRDNHQGGSKGDIGQSQSSKIKLSSVKANMNNISKKESNVTNFQASESVLTICSDRPSNYSKFCAAFPPTLSEAITKRNKELGVVKKEPLFQQTYGKNLNLKQKFESSCSLMKYGNDLSGNSILFPKTEAMSLDFNHSFFGNKKKDVILNVLKNYETDKDEKIADNMANIANDSLTENKGKSSVDSLTMMKEVKGIVDLVLQNAVTIFEKRDTEVLSVLSCNEDTGKANEGEFRIQVEDPKEKLTDKTKSSDYNNKLFCENNDDSKASNVEDSGQNSRKINDFPPSQPKSFPGAKEKEEEMKLNSVLEYFSTCNTFKINRDDLENALRHSQENFDKLYSQAVSISSKKALEERQSGKITCKETNNLREILGPLNSKNGDSILVFDELTQTWIVDYSILEKRIEQKKQEEELNIKSKLILDTFEKTEQENLSKIDRPLPDSPSPKIFDYGKAEWKVYEPEKTNSSETKKPKPPFKEPNAEEIRKKNSDLYEDLFDIKKKETKINRDGKEAPGLKSSIDTKKSYQKTEIMEKEKKETAREDSDTKKETYHTTEIMAKGTAETELKDSDDFDPKQEWHHTKEIMAKDMAETELKDSGDSDKTKERYHTAEIMAKDKTETEVKDSVTEKESHQTAEIKATGKTETEVKDSVAEKESHQTAEIMAKDKTETEVKDSVTEKESHQTAEIKATGKTKTELSESDARNEKYQKTEIKAKSKSETEVKDTGIYIQEIDDLKKDKNPDKTTEENCWETFLKSNTLPFDEPELCKKSTPIKKKHFSTDKKKDPKDKPPPPPQPPSSTLSPKKGLDIKFRIPNPFKKNNSAKPSSEKQNQPTKIVKSEASAKTIPASSMNTKSGEQAETIQLTDAKTKNFSKESLIAPKKDFKIDSVKCVALTNETSLHTDVFKIPPSLQTLDPLKTESSIHSAKNIRSMSEHYISDNILEMSKNNSKDKNSKIISNKIETVKLNITSDKKMPSVITEINLNKKSEEQTKESKVVPKKPDSGELKQLSDNIKKKTEKTSLENKIFYKNFEKYKTPFSDPEYEEKSVKINTDLESNPNLKKLDTWNKTLVLQDVAKPNENIETWLKDESDKMATLLLKVLQEAAEGKPKKKSTQTKNAATDKNTNAKNPYDNIRKKQETNSENVLFKTQSVDSSEEIDLKQKKKESGKSNPLKFLSSTKNIPVQSAKTSKPSKIVEVIKMSSIKDYQSNLSIPETNFALMKTKMSELTQEKSNVATSKELSSKKFMATWTEEVPGPEILKKISNAWKLFPIIGCQLTIYTFIKIFQLVNFGNSFLSSTGREKSKRHIFSKLFTKYGPIVNIQGPLSGNIILIHKPEHLSGVFQQDALVSVRSVFDSMDLSRRVADNKVLQTGISTDWSKIEWSNLKKKSNDPLFKGCEKFLALVEVAGDNLISKIKANKNSQNFISEDFMKEIKMWSMEGFFSVLFEKSSGISEGKNGDVTWLVEPKKLYKAVEETTKGLNKCERGFQFWRIMATPSSIGLSRSYRSLSAILTKQLYQTEINLKNKNELLNNKSFNFSWDLTFMESMLLNDGMLIEEIICNLIDMMIIGTNAMSSALGFMLYNLAQNVKVQNKLLKEVKEHLPEKNSRLDYHKLHSLKYLQACLKESLRLNAPFPLFFRLLQNDVIISNYIIPKGTYVIMDSRVASMKQQIFDEPDKFIPERWLNDERWMQANHPFSSLPFCHGPRAELGKRIAEIQLWSCLAKIVRNFEIDYQFGEIQGTENLISFPNKQLKLNFIERLE